MLLLLFMHCAGVWKECGPHQLVLMLGDALGDGLLWWRPRAAAYPNPALTALIAFLYFVVMAGVHFGTLAAVVGVAGRFRRV